MAPLFATPLTLTVSAQILANAIDINADRAVCGEITPEIWEYEQLRLWAIAAECGCTTDVLKLLAPSRLPLVAKR